MDADVLFLCPICCNIPLNQRERFLENLHYRKSLYQKGDVVARQGDTVSFLYILLKGSVKAEMISESGDVMKIETIQAPNPLAPAFLFAEENRFPVDVVALETSEIILIPKTEVMKQLTENEHFLQAYMAFNSNRTQFLSERIKLLSIKTIKGKLAQYILSRAKGMCFELDMNQTELAEYFGVARPSLSRSLMEMADDGIIALEKKQGEILDLKALRNLVMQ